MECLNFYQTFARNSLKTIFLIYFINDKISYDSKVNFCHFRISDVIVETVRQKEAYARSQMPNGRDALYGSAPKGTSGLSGRELLRKQVP